MSTTVVFDVLGTLFSLDRLRAELRELGAPGNALELWFGQSLRDYFAYSHAGGYVPLQDVLTHGLPRALRPFEVAVDEERAAAVVGAMAELEPSPGAAEACRALRDAGCRLAALSNGSLDSTTALLDRAGLRDLFGTVRSCDEIEVSKPAERAYRMVTEAGNGAWMVAAHAWDVAGARRAGLRGVWISVVEGEYLTAYPPPEIRASDLVDAAQRLLGGGRLIGET